MDVKTEILPLTTEDKLRIKKHVATGTVFFFFVMSFAFCIIHFFFVSSFGYFAYLIFGFFLFVGGIIMRGLLQSLMSTEKIVEEGYITNKRIEISSSTNSTTTTRSKSSTIKHFITLGNNEFYVFNQYYNQVKKGDLVKVEKTIKNKEVFKIEVLKSGIIEQNEHQVIPPPKTVFSRGDDHKILQKSFIKSLFFKTLLGGAGLYLFSLVIILVVMLSLDNRVETTYFTYVFYFIQIAFIAIFLLLNIKTYKLFLDLQSGQKVISKERVLDCYFKGYSAQSKWQNRDSYHVRTDRFTLSIDSELGKELKAGDLLTIAHSPKALVVFDVKRA